MNLPSSRRLSALSLIAAAALTACGGSDDDLAAAPEETRAQDSRTFAPANPTATTFNAMAAAAGDTGSST